MNKYSINSVSDLQSFSDPNCKKNSSTIVQIWLLRNNSSVPTKSVKWIIKYAA